MRNSLNAHQARRTSQRALPLTLGLYLAIPAVLAGVACRDLTSLKQADPGQIAASTLFGPANAQLLVNSAVANFECAYGSYVIGSGLLIDELANTLASNALYDYDARRIRTDAFYGTVACTNAAAIYSPLSTARATADTILAKLEGWTDAEVPNRTKLIGQAATYAGYSLVLLGEGMCSAAINVGPELTPAQLFAEAKNRFDKAITAATAAGDATTLNFALIGRARTELDLGDLTAAAADAATIPAGFVVNISTDATNTRRQNKAFSYMTQGVSATVDTSFRNLIVPGGTAPDPRVLVTNTGRTGTLAGVIVWTADKYPSYTTPMRVAGYAEAQLIVAEDAASRDDLSGAATAINNARATHTGLPVYTVPAGATGADVLAQIIEERRREFFLEGHRLGDIRRYNLPLNPPAGTPYYTTGAYGDQRCFPLPDVERINNPNLGA